MARLDNVVLVCGSGAEAFDALFGDAAVAAVHCTLSVLCMEVINFVSYVRASSRALSQVTTLNLPYGAAAAATWFGILKPITRASTHRVCFVGQRILHRPVRPRSGTARDV